MPNNLATRESFILFPKKKFEENHCIKHGTESKNLNHHVQNYIKTTYILLLIRVFCLMVFFFDDLKFIHQ
jgi:hypothetical protein